MSTLATQEATSGQVYNAPSLIRIAAFLIAKYYAFFIVLAFLGDRFQNTVLANSQGAKAVLLNTLSFFIHISWGVLLLVLALVLPVHLVLRIRPRAIRLTGLCVMLFAEYGLYTWGFSPSDFSNGLYNALLTVIFLLLFFRPALTMSAK
ncbi:MAG: hypothetical protein H6592_01110 [Flavobacteriales bacterium]|nr:hypothetical protein [Flavobacteriales bacterium]